MSNKKTMIKVAIPVAAMFMLGSFYLANTSKQSRSLGDDALLSLMKNDHEAFMAYVEAGGDLQFILPKIEGHTFTVAEAIAFFERTAFVDYLQSKNKAFLIQDSKKDYDMLSLAVHKNNPELLKLLLKENANLDTAYGKNGWSLLHMASAECSSKIVGILGETGKLNWDTKAADGTTPLTVAANHDCLSILSYWKEHGADFNAKDGAGHSALSILKTKKDAALAAFAKSFEPERVPASLTTIIKKEVIPDFYKKRQNPKDRVVNMADLIEPEDRPEDAIETAEYSEFSD